MNKNDCFYLGVVTRTQGIKGNVSVYLDVDSPEDYKEMESVFVDINNSLVPFFIEYLQVRNRSQALVKFEGVNTEEEARQLINRQLYLPMDVLPKLSGNRFYFHEITGFSVLDQTFGEIGTVKGILEYPGNTLLQIQWNDRELLIPVQDHIINRVDRDKRIIHVTAPPGLIDIYLTDNHSPEEEF